VLRKDEHEDPISVGESRPHGGSDFAFGDKCEMEPHAPF
jgi:hypothetical protein